MGLRFTLSNGDLPGNPDLANRSRKFAIFVHGCYWHRHKNCSRTTTPKSNAKFWRRKFDRNIERDAAALKALDAMRFRVAVIWECEANNDYLIDRALSNLVELDPQTHPAPSSKV